MITIDLSILNQKGTPIFYSDTLALRPAFGIAGRIFIAIDSPYGIYRDTGSAWVQIAVGSAGSGTITGGGTINTISMFTPTGTAIGDSAISQTGSNVTVTARNLIVTNGAFTLSHTHNFVNGTFNPYAEQIAATNTFNAGITWNALLACFNSSSLQSNLFNGSVTFGNGSYTTNNLNLSNITFLAAGSTITSTQASGGIRAFANQILQFRIDGTNNGTYTHYANSAIYGDFASSTASLTITNRYGYLVNNLDEYSAGHTYVNRWAFYNAGINDNNFFAGKVGIGLGYVPNASFQLDVIGVTRSTVYNTNFGTNSLNLLTSGTTAQTSDRGIFIGSGNFNNASVVAIGIGSGVNIGGGIGSVGIGFNTNASGGGVAIGSPSGSGAVSSGGVAINGNSGSTGVAIVGVSSGANSISIKGTASGVASIAIGNSANASGNYSISLGDRVNNNFQSSFAFGLFASTTNTNQLVIGGNDATNSYAIGDVYIGGGVQDLNNNNGTSVTINASGGGAAIDKNGGNIRIAGGKGTGAGTSGDVIFTTSTPLGTGTTLQTLTNRWWLKGSTGTLSNEASPSGSAILNITSTTQGVKFPSMSTAQKNAIASPVAALVVFDTSLVKLCVYNGTSWETITSI